jgi:hypothetical protein
LLANNKIARLRSEGKRKDSYAQIKYMKNVSAKQFLDNVMSAKEFLKMSEQELRLRAIRYNGCSNLGHGIYQMFVTDVQTGTTFTILPGQTLGEALDQLDARWAEAQQK